MPWYEIVSLLFVGLAAGALGGLLGIGGSIVMIPVIVLVFGHDQHLAQAAAMIVNVFVSAPAVIRHHRARAIEWTIARRMLPAGLLFIIIGVEVSNRLPVQWMEWVFGAFLIWVAIVNVQKLLERSDRKDGDGTRRTWPAASGVGAGMGFIGGLLGVGGGIAAVPLAQRLCHLPLRRCIAVSATAMCITAPLGALRKNLTLAQTTDVDDPVRTSLIIAACLVPTAIIGALIGAGFTHTMPLKWLRLAFIILLTVATARYFGLF